jgi:hypothetical protein
VYSVCSMYTNSCFDFCDSKRSRPDEPCAVFRVGRCGIAVSTVELICLIERDGKLIMNGK